jgi:hypothetical protein
LLQCLHRDFVFLRPLHLAPSLKSKELFGRLLKIIVAIMDIPSISTEIPNEKGYSGLNFEPMLKVILFDHHRSMNLM